MLKVNGQKIDLKHFPDGTLQLRAEPREGVAEITWAFESNEEMAALYFLTQHLREQGAEKINLRLPYVPNARMDRVKNSDEVFTLKYFAQFLNSLGFARVYMRDVHSGVASALIRGGVSEDIAPVVRALAKRLLTEQDILFFPDEGACQRYRDMADHPYGYGVKNRDWRSGEILSLEVRGSIPQGPFNALIVDDICSYGGTFLKAAARLKELGANKIWLYVTHCESNALKGELPGSGLVERIFTTDSIFREPDQSLVEIISMEMERKEDVK